MKTKKIIRRPVVRRNPGFLMNASRGLPGEESAEPQSREVAPGDDLCRL